MKLTTWNVNGLRARDAQVLEFLQREKPDVLCLQEIKCLPEQVPESLGALPDCWSIWHGSKGYSGVAMLIHKDLAPEPPAFEHPPFDVESRAVTVRFGDLVLASIYLPNGGKDYPAKVRFIEELIAWSAAEHAAGRKLIVAGDLNVAREERDVHAKLRKPNEIGQTAEERAMFQRLLDTGLVDVGRTLAPDDDELFTWWAPWRNMKERNIGWRIDYVLASAGVAEHAKSCVSERAFGSSDHAPLTAVIDIVVGPARATDGSAKPAAGPRQMSLI